MTSSSPAPALPRRTGTWISIVGVTAYVLASPFLFSGSLEGSLWWVAPGVLAIFIVTMGAIVSARAVRECDRELRRLDEEAGDLIEICEMRRAAMENLVDSQLPALTSASGQPPMPDLTRDEVCTVLLARAAVRLARVRDEQDARQDAVQAAVVTLGRKVQASAHRIQEEAARMVQRHPADADVLHTSMRVDHAAAQQARNAQSLAALCGEWPGQQWHQPLPLADVVRGAAGRITAYQRVEVSGDPGVAVAARVVEPLIHVVAELLANATQSSPPTTQVLVSLRHVQRGAVIEIDDGGVGLDDVRLEQVREIASGRRMVGLGDLGEIPQTGLPVVGAYVRRHGFRVDITESVYGGLRAIVLVPADLTEPMAPSVAVTAGGHALTRRAEPAAPAAQPGPAEPDPDPEPATGPVAVPAPAPVPVSESGPKAGPATPPVAAPASGSVPQAAPVAPAVSAPGPVAAPQTDAVARAQAPDSGTGSRADVVQPPASGPVAPVSVTEPATEPRIEPVQAPAAGPEPEPARQRPPATPASLFTPVLPPAPAADSADPEGEQLPELPRRQSRRAEAMAAAVDWTGERPETPTPAAEKPQSAEEAGQWMGAFLGAGRPAEDQNHQNHHDTEDR